MSVSAQDIGCTCQRTRIFSIRLDPERSSDFASCSITCYNISRSDMERVARRAVFHLSHDLLRSLQGVSEYIEVRSVAIYQRTCSSDTNDTPLLISTRLSRASESVTNCSKSGCGILWIIWKDNVSTSAHRAMQSRSQTSGVSCSTSTSILSYGKRPTACPDKLVTKLTHRASCRGVPSCRIRRVSSPACRHISSDRGDNACAFGAPNRSGYRSIMRQRTFEC